MVKNINILIISFLLILTAGFSSCSVNLGYFLKKIAVDQTFGRVDIGKTLMKKETPNFYIMIRENRTTYCPSWDSIIYQSSDTIWFKNPRLSTAIWLLLKDRKVITHNVNMKYDPKIDVMFVQKGNLSKQECIDSLIFNIQNVFNFSIEPENIKYDLVLADSLKYKNLIVNKKRKSSVVWLKSKIVCSNMYLHSIVNIINYQHNIFVDFDKSNNKKITVSIPRNNVDSLKYYLSNRCGLELIKTKPDDKYVRLEFK